MIGRKFAHYRIISLLGSGGMGEVYRARDTHLERDVAIKVLPQALVQDDEAVTRFRREAHVLSRVQHPHIAIVHDFSHEDGVAYLVMELIEGESLDQRLLRGPLQEQEVCRLGHQIASALAAAHARDIVHRDMKPSNIMITTDGVAKVLDFGIAKRLVTPEGPTVTADLTGSNAVVGTVPYMAPEQLRGGPVDARTDVFALGVVLYEMTTGLRPFSGTTLAAMTDAILRVDPTPPRTLRPEVAEPLDRLICECLEKDPTRRPASAAIVSERLQAASPRAVLEPSAKHDDPRGRRWLLAAGTLVVLSVLAVFIGSRLRGPASTQGIRSLAVLPLENLSRDPDQVFFAEGMTDELIVSLQSVRSLRVISRSSSMAIQHAGFSARQIGERLHVEGLVTGSIQRVGDRVRIRAQLIRARDDRSLWAASIERNGDDVLALQSDIARAIVDRIRTKLQPAEQRRLAAPPRVNQVALEHYLRGRFHLNRASNEDFRLAIEEFQKAIEIAPTYARPYAGLGDAYANLSGESMATSEAWPRAREALLTALRLDPGYAPAYGTLGLIYGISDHDWQKAEEVLRRGFELNPHEPNVLQAYGHLLHVSGRFDDALVLFRRAHEQDPLSLYLGVQALWPLDQGRRYAEAIAGARSILAVDSTFHLAHLILGQSLMFSGSRAQGLAELRTTARLEPMPLMIAWLGWGEGEMGHRAAAEAILQSLEERARTSVVQPYCFALVHLGLGHREEALNWLERGAELGTTEASFTRVDPVWDPIRSDARFAGILDRLGLGDRSVRQLRHL